MINIRRSGIARYEHRTNEEDSKILSSFAKTKVKCKNCNHPSIIVFADRKICSNCGHWVYRTPKLEFFYKTKEVMIKNGK